MYKSTLKSVFKRFLLLLSISLIYIFKLLELVMNYQSYTNQTIFAAFTALLSTIAIVKFFDFRPSNAMIVIHVVLGSLAFIIGGIAILSKKGGKIHKITGRLFYLLMLMSAILTLVVSLMPFHISFSMLQISVMTLYFLIGGVRSLSFKGESFSLFVDKSLSYVTIIVSFVVLFYSVIADSQFYPLRTVFGSVAIIFGLMDLWVFKRPKNLKRHWLILHLSKMTAGYTTAVTGFIVAQNVFGGYYNWFLPTVFCFLFIFYWLAKLKLFEPFSLFKKSISQN